MKDVDEMAPPIWLELTQSLSPGDFFDGLAKEDKQEIEKWRSKRGSMLQARIQQEIQAKMEDEPSLARDSTPFLKVLVKSYDRTLIRQPPTVNDEAILTIWSPSEEQCNLVKEGAVLRFENLATRDKYEGRLQLSGNGRTSISLCCLPPLPNHVSNGAFFSKRKYSSMFQINVASRRMLLKSYDRDRRSPSIDHDLLGIVVKVEEINDESRCLIYVTDKSNLVVRVMCETNMLSGANDSLGLRHCERKHLSENPRVFSFRNAVVQPFDTEKNCAVVLLKQMSSIRLECNEALAEKVQRWAESSRGRECLQKIVAHLDAGLLTLQRPLATYVPVLGYIAGLTVQSSNQLRILVDTARPRLQQYEFPFRLLQDVVLHDSSWSTVSLNSEEENVCSNMNHLGKLFRARGVLYKFVLKRIPKTGVGPWSCEFEVFNIVAADMEGVASVYRSNKSHY